jgi:kynurenine formamidase
MTGNKRWTQRPPGSNWGDFGENDQLGRLNLIGRQERLAAIREVHEGITFSLSLPLDVPRQPVLNPRRRPPYLEPAMQNGAPYFNYPLGKILPGATDVISDDRVTISPQYSTQWDALGHVGSLFDADGDGVAEAVGYNGFAVAQGEVASLDDYHGAQALSVAAPARHGVQGRGVLVDLCHHFGTERRHIGYADLMKAIEADQVEVRRGDILCLHTGFARLAAALAPGEDHQTLRSSCAVLDGTDAELLDWIAASDIAAIAADNYAVEERRQALPEGQTGPLLPLHEHCLFKLGIPLGEMWYLSDLAGWLRRHGRHAFLLTAPPLHLPGAVGSPANPIATV